MTDAVQRATDARVQIALAQLARYPLTAFGLGTLATALMQSSSATAYHLGLPCATHPATVARSNGFYTLIVAILVGGLLVNSLRTDQWIWLLPAGLALLLLFGLLASTLVVRHTSMVICTQGLLRIAGQRAESIRCEEMREAWQNAQGFRKARQTTNTRIRSVKRTNLVR
jgi:hypothetical protein